MMCILMLGLSLGGSARAVTCKGIGKTLTSIVNFPQKLSRRMADELSGLILKRKQTAFDVELYRDAVTRVEKKTLSLSASNTVEERAAIYVDQMHKVSPENSIANEIFDGKRMTRKLKAFRYLKNPKKGSYTLSDFQADRVAKIMMMPSDPVSLEFFDLFSKKKMEIKVNEALKEHFYQEVAVQGLKSMAEKEGLQVENSKLQKVIQTLSSNQGQALLFESYNLMLGNAGVGAGFIAEQNWIRFSERDLVRVYVVGVQGVYPKVYAQLKNRMKQNLIYNLSAKITVKVSAMMVLGFWILSREAMDKQGNGNAQVKALKDKTKEVDQFNHSVDSLPSEELLFRMSVEGLDSNSEEYRDAKRVYLKSSK